MTRPHPTIARILVDDVVKPCLVLGVAVLVALTVGFALFPSNGGPMQAPTWSAP